MTLVPPGTTYWCDIFQPASADALPGGIHLCVSISDDSLAREAGLVALVGAARPERKKVPIDVYRVRLDPADFRPASRMPPLDQPRSLGLELLQTRPVAALPQPAGLVALENFRSERAPEFKSLAAALRVQFQLPGYIEGLATRS